MKKYQKVDKWEQQPSVIELVSIGAAALILVLIIFGLALFIHRKVNKDKEDKPVIEQVEKSSTE